jgi:hypothetical protein
MYATSSANGLQYQSLWLHHVLQAQAIFPYTVGPPDPTGEASKFLCRRL